MHILRFLINNQSIIWTNPCREPVEAYKGVVFAEFLFDEEWNNLTRTAVFENDFAKKPVGVILSGQPVEVPPETLKHGRLYVSVLGIGSNGKTVLTTKRMEPPIRISKSGPVESVEPEDATPELWEQAMAIVGGYYSPSVDPDGTLRWSGNREGMPEVPESNIKGRDGDPGQNGENGKDGKDGFSPTVEAVEIEGGHEVTITDAQGPKRFEVNDGKTPVKGTDYYTSEDKEELFNEVISAIPTNPVIVKYAYDSDSDSYKASHSASEIKALIDAGVVVIAEDHDGAQFQIMNVENVRDDRYIVWFGRQLYSEELGPCFCRIVIDENKTVRTYRYYSYGKVNSVNGFYPDADGHVKIDMVETVNGVAPDDNGNVKIDVVKTINGSAPDENGNVEIPEGFSGSWNDLTDKPYGGSEVLLEEKTILASAINEYGCFELTDVPQLSIGEIYNVIVDGVSYRCEVIDDLEMGATIILPVDDDENFPFEPFVQWYRYVDGEDVFTGRSEFYIKAIDWDSLTLSITKDLETFDEKYLPYKTETWTFEMADGTTVEKQVVLK